MATKKNDNTPKFKLSPGLVYFSFAAMFLAILVFGGGGLDFNNPRAVSLSKFRQFVDSNQVEKVTFNTSRANIYLKESALDSKTHDAVKKDAFGKENTKGINIIPKLETPNYLKKI